MSYLNTSLKIINFVYDFSGITYQIKKFSQKQKLKMRCVYIFNFFWFNFDVLGAIYWFIDGIQIGKTFVELTYIAPCFTFSVLANTKIMFFIYYEDLVSHLYEKLSDLDAVEETNEKMEIRKTETSFLHSLLKASKILNLLLLLTFSVSPLLLTVLKYMDTNEVELILPFMIKYPFDAYAIKYWPFVYIHQFWSTCLVLLNICGSDFLLYIFCTYLRIQFRILQYDIEKIVENNNILNDSELLLFQNKFADLVKWHQELIWLTSLLERVFAKSILVNFICSSILLCLTGFNVMAIDNIAIAVTFLIFLFVNLWQIYLLCFFGDLLMTSSMEVSEAMYNSKWYNLSPRAAKGVLIVLTRTQNPCKLTAFGYADVNFRAFTSILSSSWSYFALLKTVYTPPNTET